MKTLALLGCLSLAYASASAASAAPKAGKVVGVKAGTVLEILDGGTVYCVMLHGVAGPARHEPFGKAARNFAAGMAFMSDVSWVLLSAESDGSFVAKVSLADGRDLSAEMLKAGMAWWSSQSNPGAKDLAKLEKDARDACLGLWAAPEDEAGAAWRKEVLVRGETDTKGAAGRLTSN